VKKICCCEVIDDKNPSKNVFRIVRQSKDGGYKNMDFEAPSAITSMSVTTAPLYSNTDITTVTTCQYCLYFQRRLCAR